MTSGPRPTAIGEGRVTTERPRTWARPTADAVRAINYRVALGQLEGERGGSATTVWARNGFSISFPFS
jgi:hypothetical protein